jgi:predicted flap endonuclease-1-like 5' DNA nuclease
MVDLTWTGSGVFSDPARNFTARPNTTHEFDEDRAEEYLGHQSDNWKRPEDEDSTDPETESSGESEDEDDGPGGESNGKEFADLDGIGDTIADRLRDAGYSSFDDLRNAGSESLTEVDGITESKVEKIDDQLHESGE